MSNPKDKEIPERVLKRLKEITVCAGVLNQLLAELEEYGLFADIYTCGKMDSQISIDIYGLESADLHTKVSLFIRPIEGRK